MYGSYDPERTGEITTEREEIEDLDLVGIYDELVYLDNGRIVRDTKEVREAGQAVMMRALEKAGVSPGLADREFPTGKGETIEIKDYLQIAWSHRSGRSDKDGVPETVEDRLLGFVAMEPDDPEFAGEQSYMNTIIGRYLIAADTR